LYIEFVFIFFYSINLKFVKCNFSGFDSNLGLNDFYNIKNELLIDCYIFNFNYIKLFCD